jgi:hypothetical protein
MPRSVSDDPGIGYIEEGKTDRAPRLFYRVKLGRVFSSPYYHSIRSSLRFFVTSVAIFGSRIRFFP